MDGVTPPMPPAGACNHRALAAPPRLGVRRRPPPAAGRLEPYVYRTDDYGKTWTCSRPAPTASRPITRSVSSARIRARRAALRRHRIRLLHLVRQWPALAAFQQNLPMTPVTDIRIHQNDSSLDDGRSSGSLTTSRRCDRSSCPLELPVFRPADRPPRFSSPRVRRTGRATVDAGIADDTGADGTWREHQLLLPHGAV